jgi:beta-lactamase class A
MRQFILASIFLGIGLVCGYFIRTGLTEKVLYQEKHTGQRKLINKLIDFDIPPSKELGDYKVLLQDEIDATIRSQKAISIGVYYRDLNNGPWIGVNENSKFIPASLLKVPVMLVYFKKAEINPALLRKKLKYKPSESVANIDKNYEQSSKMQQGKEYTIYELIYRMIRYSDNDAVAILYDNVDLAELKSLYSLLGFKYPESTDPADFLSARAMSSFFRVLYNATYLNEEMSEKALQFLTESEFDQGLRAGVPDEVIIAHKYGERGDAVAKELHNCGIIYYPKHPYILCVMTKGDDYTALSTIIKDISKLTYEQVKKSNEP